MVDEDYLLKDNKCSSRMIKILLMSRGKSGILYWLNGRYALEYFEKQNRLSFIERDPEEITIKDIQAVDIIYNLRCINQNAHTVLAMAKKLRKPFVYYLDDNFFALPEHYTKYHRSRLNRMKALISQADAVIVVSKYLFDVIKQYNQNVVLSRSQQIFFDDLLEKRKDGTVVIGHMSTLGREKHFTFVTPAIERIINEFGDHVKFEFIGYKPAELLKYKNVRHFDFIRNYLKFSEFLSKRYWDIGIAPLQDNSMTRCKTNNKFREFGGHGICGIYSRIPIYTDCVKHRDTGYLAENNEDAWYEAMKELIINVELRRHIVNAAHQYVKENYKKEIFYNDLMDLFSRLVQ